MNEAEKITEQQMQETTEMKAEGFLEEKKDSALTKYVFNTDNQFRDISKSQQVSLFNNSLIYHL